MKPFIQCFYKPLTLLILLFIIAGTAAIAQPATIGIPVGIGRNNCGQGGGTDSVYFFDYTSPNMTRAVYPNAYKPQIKIGPASTTNKYTLNLSSISFNPKDQKLYYLLTIYPTISTAITYVWRWKPDTTFATGGGTANYLDTLRSFPYDIGGVAFDNSGMGWTLEFPPGPAKRAFLRPIDFAAGIYNTADTLDFIPGAGGVGDTIFVPGSGDITMLPSGQMYYNFDNKLYTPDYMSYGDPTHHLKSTYIDTTRLPVAGSLVGLAYADGDLIAAYAASSGASCIYRRLDPLTADTAFINYTYAAGKGVKSVDMTQINSGVGLAKKLFSVTATGTANQYDVVYDVYVKNYGNMPITSIQIKDSLGAINTNANVSNVTAVFTSNPAALTLNPSYNGTTNVNLLNAGQTLPNYPVAKNNFTIRISCRLSNILTGIVYNNSAIATAKGFNLSSLRDSSTNGSNPDLNQNDRPDDLGEGQPTPFIVALTPSVPPCSSLSQVLYNQDFGTGVGLTNALPALPTASTTYAGSASQPLSNNRFALTDSAQRGDLGNWIKLRDHTGNTNGRMMVVNADAPANYFYRDSLNSLCPNQEYSFSFYAAFIGNATYQATCSAFGGFKFPKVKCRVRDITTGLIITEASTASITATTWNQYGIKWVMPTGYTGVIFELINDAPGGCGNDIAIDDIVFGICDAAPTATISTGAAGCIGGATIFNSALSDPAAVPGTKDYQWQVSTDSITWINVVIGSGGTTGTYTLSPLLGTDVNKYYRVIIAATGNIGSLTCRYVSPGVKLLSKAASTAAASATKSKNNICAGIPVNLGVTGGLLGAGAKWKWYSSACGTGLIDSGAVITVSPVVTTTYYVRAEGDCNITACQSVTITINCDIDKDDDGIPDYVESNMPAALADADGDGIPNAFDPDYAGFKDYNNDYIDDDFQADGDSDNDGIPNYLDTTFPGRIDSNGDGVDDRFDADLDGKINMLDLDSDNDGIPDVVEAYGVDANGDGKIDNYTDTDGDGLSQNVDANSTGARISGAGLGAPDFDNDGVPNYLDLDSDNDGIPDLVEAGGADTDNNGKVDGVFTDVNGDGMHDSYINAGALLKTGADGNGDGKADSYPNKNMDGDFRPNPYDRDSDGDGIVDVIESGLPDANLDGIVDGTIGANGRSLSVSPPLMNTITLRNTDGRGNPDYLDIDSDDDGIPDNIEGLPTAGYVLPSYSDSDGDGLDDSYDTVVGFGGSGIFVVDTDGDGTPDYRDLDTDADGQPDIKEGNDFNLNGFADDNVTLTLLDTDGDGLDNRFDSSASVKGTSYRMGNGGSLTGDAAPGARCPVQKKVPAQTDRDWRFVGSTLPVELLQFTGTLQANSNVLLNWSLITPTGINHFEIERSTDNSTFIKVGTVQQPVALNIDQHFNYTDDIRTVASEIIFYRLKIIGDNGQIKYSNVLLIRRNAVRTEVKVIPNPANDHFTVSFYAQKETAISFRLMNNIGQTVLVQSAKASAGQNSLQVNDLQKLSNGVYTLQFYVNDGTVTTKVVLHKK
ncbi:MAG: T9SS type A sorting domain-containing protein [Ferruginibacter sp.]